MLVAGTGPRYIATGHLLFARGTSLFAARFDVQALELVGAPVPVLEGIRIQLGGALFDIADDGTLIYVTGNEDVDSRSVLVTVGPSGEETPFFDEARNYRDPRLAPNGGRVAIGLVEGNSLDIWMLDALRGTSTRLSFGGSDARPIWSPDGSLIYFGSAREGPYRLFSKPSDGGGPAKRLTEGSYRVPSSVSSDGKQLVFRENSDTTGLDIGILHLRADNGPKIDMFLHTEFNEHSGMLSPDDRWLAYVSDDSGREEVYVTAFPKSAGRFHVSVNGGSEPLWSRDGKELYYRRGRAMMTVEITTHPELTFGPPQLLFEGPYRSGVGPGGNPGTNYDLTRDGRFLLVRDERAATPSEIHVVLNWFQELERLVPTDN